MLFTRHSRSVISAMYIQCHCFTVFARLTQRELGVYFKIYRTVCAMQEKSGSSESRGEGGGFSCPKIERGILSSFLRQRVIRVPFLAPFRSLYIRVSGTRTCRNARLQECKVTGIDRYAGKKRQVQRFNGNGTTSHRIVS